MTLQLWGFVKDGELRHPTTEGNTSGGTTLHHNETLVSVCVEHAMFDADGDEYLIMVKNGTTTSVTLSRSATGIKSFVRHYTGKDYVIYSTSMEVAVHSYSHEDGAWCRGMVSLCPGLACQPYACILCPRPESSRSTHLAL